MPNSGPLLSMLVDGFVLRIAFTRSCEIDFSLVFFSETAYSCDLFGLFLDAPCPPAGSHHPAHM